MKLSDVAEIRSGLVLSRKTAEPDSNDAKEYKQLNLKCIQDNGEIDLDLVENFRSKENLTKSYLTQPGDIVVRLTSPFTAVLITEATSNLVITSNFCVVRIYENQMVKGYVHWYLNSETVKRDTEKNKTGSLYSAIKPGFYMELELKELSFEDQKLIGETYSASIKELKLLEELKKKKELYYREALQSFYNGK